MDYASTYFFDEEELDNDDERNFSVDTFLLWQYFALLLIPILGICFYCLFKKYPMPQPPSDVLHPSSHPGYYLRGDEERTVAESELDYGDEINDLDLDLDDDDGDDDNDDDDDDDDNNDVVSNNDHEHTVAESECESDYGENKDDNDNVINDLDLDDDDDEDNDGNDDDDDNANDVTSKNELDYNVNGLISNGRPVAAPLSYYDADNDIEQQQQQQQKYQQCCQLEENDNISCAIVIKEEERRRRTIVDDEER